MEQITFRFKRLMRSGGLPWIFAGSLLLFGLLHELLRPSFVGRWAGLAQGVFWMLAVGSLALILWGVDRFLTLEAERQRLQQAAAMAQETAHQTERQLDALYQVGRKFVEATAEQEVLDLTLKLLVEVIGAKGASFVPLDDYGQPLTALRVGALAFPAAEAWLEYLASPAVRGRCAACENHGSITTDRSCPLLTGPFSDASSLFCLPVRGGEREFGVLNLFMPSRQSFDPSTQTFLRAIMDETALALEGVRLRRRELEALQGMQALRQKSDLTSLLYGVLEKAHHTLEADFSVLTLLEGQGSQTLSLGGLPNSARAFLQGVLQGVNESGDPLLLAEVTGDPASPPEVRSLLAAPLVDSDGATLGSLMVGRCRAKAFIPRQLVTLQTYAAQAALILQNADLMADLEYQTVMQERVRLAREIHDGLAQTLGFLKLQAAQMKNAAGRQDWERLQTGLHTTYETLTDAYQDARQAIDGLRIGPGEGGVSAWVQQIALEFQDMTGLSVEVDEGLLKTSVPPEIQAQLIRIMQEALSNVRKHAQAETAVVAYGEEQGDLWLEIRDDGMGFLPEDVPGPSRHGLRGMRERAELIGADFQVESRPGQGTVIRVRLPLAGVGKQRGTRAEETVS